MVYHHTFTTRQKARLAVFEYIEGFYNRKRRHSALRLNLGHQIRWQPIGHTAICFYYTGVVKTKPNSMPGSSPRGTELSSAFCVKVTPAPYKPILNQSGDQLKASIAGTGYECQLDGRLLEDAGAQEITQTGPGYYQLRVQNAQGCFSALSDLYVTLTPTATEVKPVLLLAPNPSQGKVRLHLSGTWKQAKMQVIDLQGRPAYQAYFDALSPELEFGLAALPAGLYSMQLLPPEEQAKQRLLLTRQARPDRLWQEKQAQVAVGYSLSCS